MMQTADEHLEEHLTTLSQNHEVVAIGECGLDYNRDFSPRDVQRSVFRRQPQLAEQLNMPVYLHERDASEDMLAILSDFKVRRYCTVLQGMKKRSQSYLAMGLYIGVTGWVCDERG